MGACQQTTAVAQDTSADQLRFAQALGLGVICLTFLGLANTELVPLGARAGRSKSRIGYGPRRTSVLSAGPFRTAVLLGQPPGVRRGRSRQSADSSHASPQVP